MQSIDKMLSCGAICDMLIPVATKLKTSICSIVNTAKQWINDLFNVADAAVSDVTKEAFDLVKQVEEFSNPN